jgi:hypothetical protein
MAGTLQNTQWNYSPYGAPGTGWPVTATPGTFASPQAYVPQLQFALQQIQQVQQLLQIVPQQIQQLQQAIQFLPQHVAQLVVQALIQSQTNVPAPGLSGIGFPFQQIPVATAQFPVTQQGYVM